MPISLIVKGKINAVGVIPNGEYGYMSQIIFSSYYDWNNPKSNWKGIIFLDSKENSELKNVNIGEAEVGIKLVNSDNIQVTSSTFSTNDTNIVENNSSAHFGYNIFYRTINSNPHIFVKDNSNPNFHRCSFHFTDNYKTVMYLENNSNDIDAINCRWKMALSYDGSNDNYEPDFYDFYDDPTLGKVLIEPVHGNPINYSKGAEDVEITENVTKSATRYSELGNNYSIYALGNPDGKEFFLEQGKSIILDMGENGDIVNGDSTDIWIFARNYSNVDTGFVYVEVSLSQNKEDWEELGFVQDITEFDISNLEYISYRYVKISNYSPTFTEKDTIGIFLDATISVHDENVVTSVPEFEYSEKTTLFSNFPNPFTNETSLTVNLPKEGNVRMAVYNLFGQQVDLVYFSYQMKGKQKFIYQPKYLPTGTYISKLYLNDEVLGSGKLVKMKK